MTDKITITREQWQKLLKDEIPLSWSNLVRATQERKLYAVISYSISVESGREIKWFTKEWSNQGWRRIPQYDLTFKEGGE